MARSLFAGRARSLSPLRRRDFRRTTFVHRVHRPVRIVWGVDMRRCIAVLMAGLTIIVATAFPGHAASSCPDNFEAFAGTTDPLPCDCSDEAVTRGSVWGMDVYTGDSNICRAGLHAGIVGARGGPVTVIPEAGRRAYPGVTRNGVESQNFGAYAASFRFAQAGAPTQAQPAAPPVPAPMPAATISICPTDFGAFAGTTDPLTCACSAEATADGRVWGMDVYTGDSTICRAALHAGAVGRNGGTVTVVPQEGRRAYAGVTRNGVQSQNYGNYDSSYRFATAGGATTAQTAPAPSPAPPPASVSVSICPTNFDAFAGTTDPLVCTCSPEAVEAGSVWGMDVYTGDSAICRAALHAGAVSRRGGQITVIPEVGRRAYPGVSRNGVESRNFGAYAASYRFAAAAGGATTAQAPVPAAPPPVTPSAAVSICPTDFVAFAGTTDPLVCTCSPDAMEAGSVWGMDVYTGDSAICRAALHAGAVSRRGGQITVIPEVGRRAYPGVSRNGVDSRNYGAFASSYRFAPGGARPTTGQAPGAPQAVATVSICPTDFVAFAGSSDPLTCTCSVEAAADGRVWGMDIYTGDSSICRAAIHAGVVGARGGPVTVIPQEGRRAYAGVTRNGVESQNYGAFASSYRFAPPERPVFASGPLPTAPPPPRATPLPQPTAAPVQAPIAPSLRDRGEVNLYVRFRTGSAELDPETIPILQELLAALRSDPGVNLGLVGHTDAVGGRDYNLALSYRRAEAVRFWLADRGITIARLAVDGRGFDQPIADNASDQGRAFNRRVQAKKL